VIKTYGKTLPGITGPPPPTNMGKRRHLEYRLDEKKLPDSERSDRSDLKISREYSLLAPKASTTGRTEAANAYSGIATAI